MREPNRELQEAIQITKPFYCQRFDIKMRVCRLESCTYYPCKQSENRS